jgi:cellulose synthase/poly-beta-1,6-N-acetylglucosamine synthase-like glycosyltransferase
MNNQMTIHKKPYIILCSLFTWSLLVFGVIWPWIHQIDRYDQTLSILAHISAGIWWGVLLWALHHLAFQLGVLFIKDSSKINNQVERPHIAILYPTCDDFNPECGESCLNQNYNHFRVMICDDSKSEGYKQQVEEFCESHKNCTLIRRPNKTGFKAGNLNYAIENHVEEEWILLVDADQLLPPDYLSKFVKALPGKNSNIAFIQASQEPCINEKSSPFQIALSPEIQLYYLRDLGVRESFGFVPVLGHGVMIRRSAWKAVGKFPEIVSEDFAFVLRLAKKKQQGIYLKNAISYEMFPYDFGGFMIRLKKFSGGTAELFRKELFSFLFSSAKFVEKWDLLMSLFWYVMMPLITINGFLGAYVCHSMWKEGISYIQPVLPYLYTWLLLSIFSLTYSITQRFPKTLKFYFWSTAIYAAAMPISGLSFLKHLFVPAKFKRTPKNQEKVKLDISGSFFMIILGIAAVFYGFKWLSPFSPILLGHGAAYLSYPLYNKLNSNSSLGKLVRLLIYIPGILLIFALYALWEWGRY